MPSTRSQMPSSPRLSSLNEFSSVLNRSPSNNWTNLQKETLLLLVEEYRFDWKVIRRIFNTVFQRQILCSSGLSDGALRSYYWGLKRGIYPINGEKSMLRAYATDLIQKMTGDNDHTEVVENSELGFPVAVAQKQAHARFLLFVDELGTYAKNHPDCASQNYLKNQTCKWQTMPKGIETHHITLTPNPASAKKAFGCNNADAVPLLAFRAFSEASQGLNSKDGFLAGIFQAGLAIQQPDPASEQYRQLVIKHVERNNKNLSPLIR